MEIDGESTSSQDGLNHYFNKKTVTWNTDTSIATTTEDLFSQLKDAQQKAADNGELEDLCPDYKKPQDKFIGVSKINQRIHFNLIRHRGTSADTPTLKLFKSFTTTLKKADPSLIILPFLDFKQHYSSLSTINHIKPWKKTK
jgi:hypothetical protein